MSSLFAPDMKIAKDFGINEAFIVCNLDMVLSGYETKMENPFALESEIWGKMTITELVHFFPYMTEDDVKKALQHLIDSDFIKDREYEGVKYYTFTEKGWRYVK